MILGIDPGILKLGYALIKPNLEIVEAGILKLELEENNRIEQFQRIVDIEKYFSDLLEKNPEIYCISMEKYFFTKFNLANAEFVY